MGWNILAIVIVVLAILITVTMTANVHPLPENSLTDPDVIEVGSEFEEILAPSQNDHLANSDIWDWYEPMVLTQDNVRNDLEDVISDYEDPKDVLESSLRSYTKGQAIMERLSLNRIKTKAGDLKEIRFHDLPPESEEIHEKKKNFFTKLIDYWI